MKQRIGLRSECDVAFIDGFQPEEKYEPFNTAMFRTKYRRDPTQGEIRCTQVHRFAMREFLGRSEEWALVLEDDATVVEEFTDFLTQFDYFPREASIILVGQSRQEPKYGWLRRLCDPLFDCRTVSGKWFIGSNDMINLRGTVGYMVNREAANILLDSPCAFLADDYSVWRAIGIDLRLISSLLIYEDLNTQSLSGNPIDLRHGKGMANILKLLLWATVMKIPQYLLHRQDIFYQRFRRK